MSTTLANSMHAVIACAGSAFAPIAAGTDEATGQPTKTFRKEVIYTGKFEAPSVGAFEVTEADLDHWVETSKLMLSNGVKIIVPEPVGSDEHPDTSKPALSERNRGYVTNFHRDPAKPNSLLADFTLIGEDAIRLASRNDVSIWVPPFLKDGKGNVYERPIGHVAITPVPVIPGLGKFTPIAASAGGATLQVPVYRLAQESSAMDLKKLAAKFGINTEGMDDQAIMAAIAAKADALTGQTQAQATSLSQLQNELSTLRANAPKKLELSADVAEMMADATAQKLEALKLSGKINAAEHDLWSAVLVGKADARPALSLSRAHATAAGLANPLSVTVLEILGKREPARQVNGQPVALSRETPGGQEDTEVVKTTKATVDAHNARFANSAL